MDETLQSKLEQLVALKSQVEMLTEQRKERQAELLENDEVYNNFKALEDEKTAEYEALRKEVSELGLAQNLNGKFKTEHGAVSFTYAKSYELADEEAFKKYCSEKNILDNMYKMTLKKTEFNKLASSADLEDRKIDGVETKEVVNIAVSLDK